MASAVIQSKQRIAGATLIAVGLRVAVRNIMPMHNQALNNVGGGLNSVLLLVKIDVAHGKSVRVA